MNDDFLDMFAALERIGARFLVVGAHAMALHGVPRATGDLDIWVSPDPDNARKVWQALAEFGAPVEALGVSPVDLETPGNVVQLGLPPRRIDIMTSISGVEFDAAWTGRDIRRVGSVDVPFLNRDDLARNKRAAGRPKDIVDLEILEGGDRHG